MLTFDAMPLVLVACTVIDLVAVVALAWIVVRSRRDRDATLAEQRAALGHLKGDLAQLLDDAERRAKAVEERLDLPREPRPAAERRGAPVRQNHQPAPPPVRDLRAADAAEARLLRDLEVHLAPGKRA